MTLLETESTEQFLSGGGEMGKLIRTMDWSQTALGPIEDWPQSLRTSVSLCLSSTFPILIAWGPETIQIYNDSYLPICGAKHPESMGQNFRICWETALPVVGAKFARGEQGEGTYITDQRMFLDRYGYLEETFMTFSFAPIRDESGGVGGIFHPITETTDKMLSARRTQILRDVGAVVAKAKSVEQIAEETLAQYIDYQLDIPFMMLYGIVGDSAKLISSAGLEAHPQMTPEFISLDSSVWSIKQFMELQDVYELTDLNAMFGNFSCPPYEIAPHTAIILPLRISGQADLFGFAIAGVSACRALDKDYRNFYELLANTYNTALTNVYAYEQEQKRAEALAEIDRSKTAFFNNVSHEFRTPLTLMLGPLEELLHQEKSDSHHVEQLSAIHRNALRLLKMVNNLLDYSRVEAGRVQARYRPLDLKELTTDLSSSFRSIIEKSGMQLYVECAVLDDQFFVDQQMWEKIVLNLLSNAFKYTLEGSITVSLTQVDNEAVLSITDTGVGIPARELPHMFERFHRIENIAGRTHEGTGIGLSLVNELVHLHGGKISVTSIEAQGSTFTVRIPAGKTHLPQDQIDIADLISNSSVSKGAFIREAYSLLEEESENNTIGITRTSEDSVLSEEDRSFVDRQVLIVDDNTDMRNYLRRLLEPYFKVLTAINGEDGLSKIKSHDPDLVLSDIMMPIMDGKTMLGHIRENQHTSRLPVIFLSARAGEEARIDGLEAGADDYLVKPFSAAELLTKIRAQIKINQFRGYADRQLRLLLKDAPVAMTVYRGPEYLIELPNERMLQYWGKRMEEVNNKPLFDAIPELELQGFRQIIDKVYHTGENFVSDEMPIRVKRNNAEETSFVHLTLEALTGESGQVVGVIAVAADVSEQVQGRKAVEKLNNTLQLAISASQMGIWSSEAGTDRISMTERGREIHGFRDEELSFTDTFSLVVPEHREKLEKAIYHAIETNGRFDEDYQIIPLGSTDRRWVNSSGMAELDATGGIRSVTGTILDITEPKEDDLRKNDFIGMVSHELKTPLTSLSGYTQVGLARARKIDDQVSANFFEKAQNQVYKMVSLINGFLNVSRLESGKIQLNMSMFRIDELIREVVVELSSPENTISFLYELEDIRFEGDKEKLGTVLTNLIGNALKYAPKGETIVLSCKHDGDSVLVGVKDQGPGIKSTELSKLFDRYYRVENDHHQHISGFGIGLYLSSEIIKRHHGQIWAESIFGSGSTFYFTLPFKIQQS